MFQPITLFIGLRYSRSKNRSGFVSFITFFSIIGITLGVAALCTVVSVMNGFESELKKRILGIVPHVMISAKTPTLQQWQNIREQVLTIPAVQQVTPIINGEALVQSNQALHGVLIQGIKTEFELKNIIANNMVQGDFNHINEMPFSIIIGRTLADKLQVGVGETVRIVLPNKTRFTPIGRIPVQRNFSIAGLFYVGSQLDESVIYMASENAQKLMALPENSFTHLRLYLDDAFNEDHVIKQLNWLDDSYTLTSWKESQGALFSAVKMEKNLMWLMLSLIIAVAAFNIVSALVMVVIDKQGEIGILQTLGLNRADIVKVFVSQGLFNGVFGTILGTILGVLLTFNINPILSAFNLNLFGAGYGSQQLPINFLWQDLLIIIVGALLMTLLASLYPAYRASKTQPAEVLRNE